MKRKKQVGESSNEGDELPTQKKTQLGTRTEPTVEDYKEENGAEEFLMRRMSGRGNAASEDGLASPTSQDAEVDEEAPEDDGAEEEQQQEVSSEELDVDDEDEELVTPLKRGKNVLGSARKGEPNGTTPIKGKSLFSTPNKTDGASDTNGTPRLERHADRSARRKSTRKIIEQAILGTTSDNGEEDEELARNIYELEDEDILSQGDAEGDEEPSTSAPATPSKRGRKKGTKNRVRSPTPPQDLPPHELYFSQNRGGHSKTSNANLSTLALLDHEEYFNLARAYKDPHANDLEALQELHASLFSQWHFELSQDFNLCLYGWGSKRSLLMKFAEYIYKEQPSHTDNKIVVVNGYVHNLTIRDVLNTVATAVSDKGTKLGSQPAEILENLIAMLEEDMSKLITVIIHSIDGAPLRRPATQTILSRLSSHPQIHLVASADHPSFPLLWDSSLRSTFNFLFHDCTTFQPYTSEVDVVDEVHELLGRSGRRVGGKQGVSFVLKSLPENAKNLFRVLIGEQLAAMDENPATGFEDNDDEDNDNGPRATIFRKTESGVEYRVLYQKAVEEFICSNEMNFRTLLKEFHDHQMIQSRKDALGTEMLSVPFRKDELETILEDLTS